MSDSIKRPHAQMLSTATGIVERLRPACERIEIAGSLRRKRPMVGDIEIVAVPKLSMGLFGPIPGETEVDSLLRSWPITLLKNGEKYKQFTFIGSKGSEFKIDLFLQPDPATWGVNFMVRTGSAEFTTRMVTSVHKGGLCPAGLNVKEARVWRGPEVLDTPEEADVFRLWGMDFIAPESRNV